MLVQSIFPSLFGETAAISAMFIGANVKKSEVNPNCAIIKAANGKPLEWLFDYLHAKGFDTVVMDRITVKSNTDGSISIFDKEPG